MTMTPQRALALVLLPSGQRGREVLDVARTWAAEGLLNRGLWVLSDDVRAMPGEAPDVRGLLLDHAQSSELDVARVLAGVRVASLTMVVMQICTPDQPVDDLQLQAADLLTDALASARPESLRADDGGDPVKFTVANLLTGPTGMSGVPYAQVASRSSWRTVVASPEDRRAADQMDRFVRADDNLVPWAAAQACSLAGLWAGMTQTPWESGIEDDSALAQGDFAIPMRSFARVVTSAPTARRALAMAMDETRYASGNVLTSEHVLPVSDPDGLLAQTLDALDRVDDGRLQYETPQPVPAPERRKTPFKKAVSQFTRFAGTEMAALPRFVMRRASARWSGRATKVLSGDEGAEEITVLGEGSDLSVYQEQFERQAVEAERELGSLAPAVPPSAPELWRTLTRTTFALLDGSPVPPGIPEPQVADHRVVLPSALLTAPPPQPWEPSAGEEELDDPELAGLSAAPCDSHAAERIAGLLSATFTAREQSLQKAEARLSVAQDELDEFPEDKPKAVAPEGAEPTECGECGEPLVPGKEACVECFEPVVPIDDDDDTNLVGRHRARIAVAVAESGVEEARRRTELTKRVSASLEEWLSVRENSLLWRLSKRIDHRTRRAEEDRERFHAEAVSVPTIDSDEPRRARNQFANRFLLMLSIGLLMSSLVSWFGALVPVAGWVLWVLIMLVMLVWLVVILTSYYRRRSRFLRTVEALQHHQRDALRRSRESAQARDRLSGLYEQLQDWAEILGHSVHDPWQPDIQWFTGTVATDFSTALPSCVDLAVPDPDDAVGTRLLRRAATRSITGDGWRSRTFHVLHDLLLIDGGYDPSDLRAAAMLFDDAPATPNGARAAMLEQLRSGSLQSQCARRVLESKIAGLYAEHDALMNHEVLPVNSEFAAEQTGLLDEERGLEKLKPSWGDYLQSALQGATRFGVALWSARGRTDNVIRSSMQTKRYAPPGLDVDGSLPEALLLAALPADKNRGIEVVVRCDFGVPVEKDALLLFSGGSVAEPGTEPRPVERPWVEGVESFN